MKKLIILSLMAMVLPINLAAQDDLYFVPTKANVKKSAEKYGIPKDTYYCGSNRNVDEYNRRLRSKVEYIDGDSTTNDIINFDAVRGEYPDSLSAMQQDDYKCTRKMSRWDDYDCRDAYWHGYTDGRYDRWYGWGAFYDPWYYSSWYGWYDPWLYSSWYGGWYGGWYGWHGGWYGGWYDPWYYGGWYPHNHIIISGGGGGLAHNSSSSTYRNHGAGRAVMGRLPDGSNRILNNSSANRAASRSFSSGISTRDRVNNGSRNSQRATSTVNRWYNNQNTNRNNTNYNNRNFESRPSSSYSNGSMGGNRSGSFSSGSMGGGSRGGFTGGGGLRNSGGRR